MTNKSLQFPYWKREKTLHFYPHVPVTPPSKGSNPIDFGNASCSPVIIGSNIAIWEMLEIKVRLNIIQMLIKTRSILDICTNSRTKYDTTILESILQYSFGIYKGEKRRRITFEAKIGTKNEIAKKDIECVELPLFFY